MLRGIILTKCNMLQCDLLCDFNVILNTLHCRYKAFSSRLVLFQIPTRLTGR